MASLQDCSVGIGLESSFKTRATPTRWFEYPSDAAPGFDWNKNIVQGAGLRVGSRVPRSARRVIPTAQGSGPLTLELASKGLGLLFQNALGTGVSNLVSGTTFQQLFTLSTGAVPQSFSTQIGEVDATGTVNPVDLLGCMINQLTINMPNAAIGRLVADVDYADISTAQAYAAPSYASAPSLFHFANWRVFTGTLTAPTTTALASATTELLNLRDASVVIPNNLIADRFNSGGGGRKKQQLLGPVTPNGQFTAEYDSTTFRDAMIGETPMCLLFQYTGAALSTGVETLQIVLPEVKLDSPLQQAGDGTLSTTQYTFQALDNLTATQPIWVVVRTADNAL